MRNKDANLLDIPLIQKEIHEKHKKFIENYGSAAEKVMADHKLFADIVMAKLYRLAIVYKEEKVIDDVKLIEDGPYRKVCLSKADNVTYINISTNGSAIIMEGFNYTAGLDNDFHWQKEKITGVNQEDFDWVDFSRQLLDYIHSTIYGRKEAMEARLQGMFQVHDLSIDENPKKKLSRKKGNK